MIVNPKNVAFGHRYGGPSRLRGAPGEVLGDVVTDCHSMPGSLDGLGAPVDNINELVLAATRVGMTLGEGAARLVPRPGAPGAEAIAGSAPVSRVQGVPEAPAERRAPRPPADVIGARGDA